LSDSDHTLIRLNKLMADRGLCSRRESDRLIEAGHVIINGTEKANLGQRVTPDVKLEIVEAASEFLEGRYVIALNKPIGYVSNLPQADQKAANELLLRENYKGNLNGEALGKILNFRNEFAVAGRLDLASRGLLILSNDGRVVREITQSHWCKKTYMVTLMQSVSSEQVSRLEKMRRLGQWTLLPMQVTQVGDRCLKFILQEGKKHQIRQVCRSVNLFVKDLYRIKIGPIELSDLPSGSWRVLSDREVEELLPKKS